jgi:G3E family GTPase
MTTISSMTNESVIFEPPMPIGTRALPKNTISPPAKTEMNKNHQYEKKTRKTIRDFNPNPNLLSKKAVQTRKQKMEEFGRFRYWMKDKIIRTKHDHKTKHAFNNIIDNGPEEDLLKRDHKEHHSSSTKVDRFDRKVHELGKEKSVGKVPGVTSQILRRRQKQLLQSDTDSFPRPKTEVDLTTRSPWRYHWKDYMKATNSVKNKLGKHINRKPTKHHRNPARKVLKGRRRISSAEFHSKTF